MSGINDSKLFWKSAHAIMIVHLLFQKDKLLSEMKVKQKRLTDINTKLSDKNDSFVEELKSMTHQLQEYESW